MRSNAMLRTKHNTTLDMLTKAHRAPHKGKARLAGTMIGGDYTWEVCII
jgi:hypothetical protein